MAPMTPITISDPMSFRQPTRAMTLENAATDAAISPGMLNRTFKVVGLNFYFSCTIRHSVRAPLLFSSSYEIGNARQIQDRQYRTQQSHYPGAEGDSNSEHRQKCGERKE
jgi:hypothetical protein